MREPNLSRNSAYSNFNTPSVNYYTSPLASTLSPLNAWSYPTKLSAILIWSGIKHISLDIHIDLFRISHSNSMSSKVGNYVVGELLGKGSFARVHKCIDETTNM